MTKRYYIEQARIRYQTNEIEIDDNAKLSKSDSGVWVAAWVWLPNLGGGEES